MEERQPPPHRSAGGNAYRSGKARPRKHRDHAQSTRVPRPPRAHGQRGRFRVRKRPANAGTRTSPARNHRRGGHVSRLHRQTEPKRPTSRRCRPGEGHRRFDGQPAVRKTVSRSHLIGRCHRQHRLRKRACALESLPQAGRLRRNNLPFMAYKRASRRRRSVLAECRKQVGFHRAQHRGHAAMRLPVRGRLRIAEKLLDGSLLHSARSRPSKNSGKARRKRCRKGVRRKEPT